MIYLETNDAPAAIGPYSQAMDLGSMVFFSGQIALTPEGTFLDESIEVQTTQVLKNISAILKEAILQTNNIAKTTIYLSDMDNFDTVNEIYAEFFGDHKPARSTIAVKTLPKNAKVEIEVIAVR